MATHFQERRHHPRKMGDGLIALVNGKVHPVTDISVSGICFQGAGHKPGDQIRLTVAALHALDDNVEAHVTIKSAGGGLLRGEFSPTTKLMRYIIGHVGDITGSQPAYFR